MTRLTARELETLRAASTPPPLAAGRSGAVRRRGGGAHRCHTCGQTFTAYAPAERHADTHQVVPAGHAARIEWEDRCDAPNAATPSGQATTPAGST